jgi:hypothetical protein
MFRKFSIAGLAAAGALGLTAAPAFADTAPQAHATNDCFFANQWQGWKSPSPDVIYIRVNISDIYRLDLSAGSSELQDPDAHLVSDVRGSGSICSPLDLDLSIAETHGIREPLIVKAMTKLTPTEAAAIPKQFRP